MDSHRRLGGFHFHVKRDGDGFAFEVKPDPEYKAARDDVFRLVDQVVVEARRAGVTVPEILAYLARNGRTAPPAANE